MKRLTADNRIDWIDALRGFGIILVIWGHLNIPLLAETVIYSFHMPLFFFISGYLHKRNKRDFTDTLKRKVMTLLIPYFAFALISIVIDVLKNILIDHEHLEIGEIFMNLFFLDGSVGWNSPIWFLVVLFIIEMVVFLLDKSRVSSPIWLCVFVLSGYLFSITGIEYPLGLHIVCWGTAFYLIGMLCRKYEVIDYLSGSPLTTVMSSVALILANISYGVILNQRISVYHNDLGNYWYFMISAIAGCLLMAVIFSKIPTSKYLIKIGKNTLLILATQYMLFLGYKLIDKIIFKSDYMDHDSYAISLMLTAVTVLLYVPLAYIVNKYLPIIVGKKRG